MAPVGRPRGALPALAHSPIVFYTCLSRILCADFTALAKFHVASLPSHRACAWRRRRTKIFRFNEPTKEWKERGTGDVRFLKSKDGEKVLPQAQTPRWCPVEQARTSFRLGAGYAPAHRSPCSQVRVLMRAEKTLRVRANHPRERPTIEPR